MVPYIKFRNAINVVTIFAFLFAAALIAKRVHSILSEPATVENPVPIASYYIDGNKYPEAREELEKIELMRDSVINALANGPTSDTIDKAHFYALQNQVKDLAKNVQSLNSIMMESPEKVITIPLMRQKMDIQNESLHTEMHSVKEDVARVYDMIKWMIGLMITMFVSVAGLVINNIFYKGKS